jgi:glycosyltransferase involved in cell wall biosynthesis
MIVTNSLTGGGAERSMNLVANELTSRGWTVKLVPINSGEADLVVPLCEVIPLQRKWQSGALDTAGAIYEFNQVVSRYDPELIILNCDLPELFGAILFSKRILIAVEHVNRPWITRKVLGRAIRRILRMRKVVWVAVSSHLTIWPDKHPPRAILMNSIINVKPILKKGIVPIGQKEISRLVFIGRLTAQKRPDWLTEVCKLTKLPGIILGEGSMRLDMEERIKIEKLPITFEGQVTNPWEIINRGDLLIVPSEYEGDGLVVIEGLANRVPMLLADIPEFRRFNLPEHFYCQNTKMFAETISEFSHKLEDLVPSPEIVERILSHRSISQVGNAWEEFLNSL